MNIQLIHQTRLSTIFENVSQRIDEYSLYVYTCVCMICIILRMCTCIKIYNNNVCGLHKMYNVHSIWLCVCSYCVYVHTVCTYVGVLCTHSTSYSCITILEREMGQLFSWRKWDTFSSNPSVSLHVLLLWS